MPPSLAEIYTDTIYRKFSTKYGAWMLGENFKLGDYGRLEKHHFIRLGNIDDFGIKVIASALTPANHQQFKSDGAGGINFHAGGGAPNVKAGLSIDFSGENAVFFNAAQCQIEKISNYTDVRKKMERLARTRKWNIEHVVVTELFHSASTTVVITGRNNASIKFEASTDVPYIDLVNVNTGLICKSASSVEYSVASTQLIPMIGLSRVAQKRNGLFRKKPSDFGTLYSMRMVDRVASSFGSRRGESKYVFGRMIHSTAKFKEQSHASSNQSNKTRGVQLRR